MTYTITAPAGRLIRLWYVEFAIFADPDNTYDQYDFTYEYDGADDVDTDCDDGDYIDVSDVYGTKRHKRSAKPAKKGSSKLYWGDDLRMCGFYDPTSYPLWATESSSNQVTVTFHTTTDPKTADNKGFKIFLTDDNGEFTLNTTVTGLPAEM